MKKFVVYTRVSTKRQGDSGLGLAAQERDIDLYLTTYADVPYEVIGTFCDIESGTKNTRQEMNKALDLVRQTGATMLVAKLDRLSRSVAFIATLMEDKRVDLKVAAIPTADKMMLHMYAVMSEAERDFISLRTSAALQAAKARGTKLGGARPNQQARHDAVKALAVSNADRVAPIIMDQKKAGKTYRDIADQLNVMLVPTARGGKWHNTTVRNYHKMLQNTQVT